MLLLCIVLAAQSVTIDDPAYLEAQRLSDDFEYERAVFRFREALRHELDDLQRAHVEVQLALAYTQLGEEDDAIASFADALTHHTLLEPPTDMSQKASALFERGRALRAERERAARVAKPVETLVVEDKPKERVDRTWERDSTLSYVGASTATVGALVVVAGVASQLVAVDLFQQGSAAEFQDDAARFKEASTTGQVLAYSLWGTGAGLALLGGAMVFVGE